LSLHGGRLREQAEDRKRCRTVSVSFLMPGGFWIICIMSFDLLKGNHFPTNGESMF